MDNMSVENACRFVSESNSDVLDGMFDKCVILLLFSFRNMFGFYLKLGGCYATTATTS